MSCDSLMPFNCCEFTLAYLRWLSFRIASTALTSFGDIPVPLNSRMGGTSFAAGGAQAVRASDAMHEMSRMLWFFTRCDRPTLTRAGPTTPPIINRLDARRRVQRDRWV